MFAFLRYFFKSPSFYWRLEGDLPILYSIYHLQYPFLEWVTRFMKLSVLKGYAYIDAI